MKKAIVPGSFDPMTLGHLWVIHRAAEVFDEVLVACMTNQSKHYLFTPEERVHIIESAIPELNNVRVCSSDEMLYQLAKREGATAIVKGFRSPEDVAISIGKCAPAWKPSCCPRPRTSARSAPPW